MLRSLLILKINQMAESSSQQQLQSPPPPLQTASQYGSKTQRGFNLNIGSNRQSNNDRKDNQLTSSVLSSGNGSYFSQGRMPYLSPRVTDNKPGLNAGLQMMNTANINSVLKTARDSSLQQDSLGRVQKNNYFKNQQFFNKQQDSQIAGRLLTPGSVVASTQNASGSSTIMSSQLNSGGGFGMRAVTAATNGVAGLGSPNFQIGKSISQVAGRGQSQGHFGLGAAASQINPFQLSLTSLPKNQQNQQLGDANRGGQADMGNTARLSQIYMEDSMTPKMTGVSGMLYNTDNSIIGGGPTLSDSQGNPIILTIASVNREGDSPDVDLMGQANNTLFNAFNSTEGSKNNDTLATAQGSLFPTQPSTTIMQGQNSLGDHGIINIVDNKHATQGASNQRKTGGAKTRNYKVINESGGDAIQSDFPSQNTYFTTQTNTQSPLNWQSQTDANMRNNTRTTNSQSPNIQPIRRNLNSTTYGSSMVNFDDITPEMAAYVVRNYLLPMFESDFKKSQRSKRQGEFGSQGGPDQNTVYGELKLSEKLQVEIYSLRDERDKLREHMEQLTFHNQELEKQVKELLVKGNKTKVTTLSLSTKLKKLDLEKQSLMIELQREEEHNQQFLNLITVSETYRKQFASKLYNEKVKNEKSDNHIIEMKNLLALKNMEADIMGDQLNGLYVAVSQIGEGKKQADKKQCELDNVLHNLNDLRFEKEVVDHEYQSTVQERDRLRLEVKDLARLMKRNIDDKEKILIQMKEKIQQLEEQLKQALEDAMKFQEEFQKSDKLVKMLQNERDKMRQRIQKLKNRRNFNINQKICKFCGKEYLEKENFNWSCRTHRSDYGGEMWWCCGKTSKDAPGCKFAKHFCKEDEDEDAADQNDPANGENNKHKNKNERCFCCKEKGHGSMECPRDPNLKTSADFILEEKRLAKAKDFKKLLSDSLGVTSKFFKSLIKRDAGENEFNPFSKGALSFDDYSYKYFNDVVLNPKAIRAMNEEQEDLLNQSSKQVEKNKNGSTLMIVDDESNLTVDQIREFESKGDYGGFKQTVGAVTDEASLATLATLQLPLGDFLPKDVVSKIASSHSLSSETFQANTANGGDIQIQPPLTDSKPQGPPTNNTVADNLVNKNLRKGSLLTDDEAEEDEDAAHKMAREQMKPRITQQHVDFLFMKQEEDPFDSIWDMKNELKFEYISAKPVNLVDIGDSVRDLYMEKYKSTFKGGSQRNLLKPNQASQYGGKTKIGGNSISNDPLSELNFPGGAEWFMRGGAAGVTDLKQKSSQNVLNFVRADGSMYGGDSPADFQNTPLRPIREEFEEFPDSVMLPGKKSLFGLKAGFSKLGPDANQTDNISDLEDESNRNLQKGLKTPGSRASMLSPRRSIILTVEDSKKIISSQKQVKTQENEDSSPTSPPNKSQKANKKEKQQSPTKQTVIVPPMPETSETSEKGETKQKKRSK